VRLRTLLLILAALVALPAARLTGLIPAAAAPRKVAVAPPGAAARPPARPLPSTIPSTVPAVTTPTTRPPTVEYVPTVVWTVARVRSTGVDVYGDPTSPEAALHVTGQTEFGTPRVLPVIGQQDGWFEVRLPVRPNNAVGWVRTADVDQGAVADRIYVSLANRNLQWVHGQTPVLQTTVGLGSLGNPTPPGEYYVTDIIPSSGAYGPWIVALNGHSETLTDFEGGDARLAVHGTNDPSSIGATTSHGCVHVPNDIDSRLASVIQPGTLVEVGY
jgi:lipoprotein-anchoring transpeptidase ErfK/SrfK